MDPNLNTPTHLLLVYSWWILLIVVVLIVSALVAKMIDLFKANHKYSNRRHHG